jgi:ABC-type histidine transport system ATPase subunit
VPQEEVLLPCFTVQETLLYAALLRLPQRWGRHEKALIVEQVLSELGLMECKDVLVGSVEKKGISGGQRHRLSIGLELLVDPSVLLLDVSAWSHLCTPTRTPPVSPDPAAPGPRPSAPQEPTSGLDSTTAEDMCGLLLSLAQPGRCVVCSIHQPSARIFRVSVNAPPRPPYPLPHSPTHQIKPLDDRRASTAWCS